MNQINRVDVRSAYKRTADRTVYNKRNPRAAAAERKAKANERKAVVLLAVLTAIVITSILFAGKIRTAKAEEAEPSYKYYTSIEVQPGDSLWSIAGDYMDDHYKNRNEYIDEVKTLNHLIGDDIHAGGHLLVPYYSMELK